VIGRYAPPPPSLRTSKIDGLCFTHLPQVCNVGGPHPPSENWPFWASIVETYLEEANLSAEDKAWIWAKSASTAYGIADSLA
jgi:hypothetical protein